MLIAGSLGAARAPIEARGPARGGGIEPGGPGATSGSIRFSDVTPLSDFDYRSNNDFTGRKYFPQPMCGGIAVLDFDGDGRQDIFFTNGAKLPELKKTDRSFYGCLLRNRGDRRFEDVTATAGLAGEHLGFSFGVAAADYDNDGDTDLFICNAGENALYRNNGDGTFVDVLGLGLDRKPRDLLSVAAAWLDYDRDGGSTSWSRSTPTGARRETAPSCSMPDGQTSFYCSPTTVASVPHTLPQPRRRESSGRLASRASARCAEGHGHRHRGLQRRRLAGRVHRRDTEPNFLFVNRRNGRFERWRSSRRRLQHHEIRCRPWAQTPATSTTTAGPTSSTTT
jgi:hypothetical protein